MKRENRKLTAAELRLITSRRPVLRKIPPLTGKERAQFEPKRQLLEAARAEVLLGEEGAR